MTAWQKQQLLPIRQNRKYSPGCIYRGMDITEGIQGNADQNHTEGEEVSTNAVPFNLLWCRVVWVEDPQAGTCYPSPQAEIWGHARPTSLQRRLVSGDTWVCVLTQVPTRSKSSQQVPMLEQLQQMNFTGMLPSTSLKCTWASKTQCDQKFNNKIHVKIQVIWHQKHKWQKKS